MSLKIEPFRSEVMVYCNNEHMGVGLSVSLTCDEARRLAQQLSAAADEADTRQFGQPIGQSRACWGNFSPKEPSK